MPSAGREANRNRTCRRHTPNSLWLAFSTWYINCLSRVFAFTGNLIAHHPWLAIAISLSCVGFCSVGFVWLKTENRAEKLFIPQDSRATKDLAKAKKNFVLESRIEIAIFLPKETKGNVLSSECLRDVLTVHEKVLSLDSYKELCLSNPETKSSPEMCLYSNPLEIFNFNKTNLGNAKLKLEMAYRKKTLHMRNGRPIWYSFGGMFGDLKMNNTSGIINHVGAIRVIYFMKNPVADRDVEKIMDWEKSFVDSVMDLRSALTCMEVHVSAQRSLDDAIGESTGTDITFISVTYMLMIAFACTMLGKFRNPLTGHSLLANAGIMTVFLGILAGFGFAIIVQTPFVSIVGALPFLIIGIGIDDMFIIVDELDRMSPRLSVTDTIKVVMANSGATITMTTMTDLVAFAVSTSSELPAIQYFCTYAAMAIAFAYLMIVTLFVALMTFDVRRIKAGRRDFFPVCFVSPPKEGELAWDEPRTQTASKVLTMWGRVLMRIEIKCIVVVISLVLFGCGMYGAWNISEDFDPKMLAKDGSPYLKFKNVEEQFFPGTIEVNIIIDEKLDYSDPRIQKEILKLTKLASENPYYENSTMSWMAALVAFSEKSNMSIAGPSFMPALQAFLRVPVFTYFTEDLRFSSDRRELTASRVLCYMKGSLNSIGQRDAMETLRYDIDEQSNLPAYAITKPFTYFEQYAITFRATVRNLVIAGVAILIITFPFLVDFSVTILVFFGFVALVFELFGLMYVWGVSLNGVSMINLIMAIGFSIDYSAHIAHAYVMSCKAIPEDRVIDALRTLGASVLMGGTSTFIGMVMLAFASSEIFRIFFKMFFGIVFLGLLHGLCFLPVYLTIFCRRPSLRIRTQQHAERTDCKDDPHEMNGTMHKGIIQLDSLQPLANDVSRELAHEEPSSSQSPGRRFASTTKSRRGIGEKGALCPKDGDLECDECDQGVIGLPRETSSPGPDRETMI